MEDTDDIVFALPATRVKVIVDETAEEIEIKVPIVLNNPPKQARIFLLPNEDDNG